ncbi:SDR family NAD(P)-dependent oxidoreductase [Paenibacillus sp. PK4536]|uniref:SDR family NAD(P)-dependent oxidoreductase n=1 Tax=Paenibacillus sp. PK4536 TaxID=3024576 RepID=UPI002359FE58|nr:SDR family NAD(P)-dependent oxidoreductase [Paenibacillus sp. PK4536]WIM39940.1 SDR family NAD(P)-dependent oxidoreductase [Paenibacillus sp. PK4536]
MNNKQVALVSGANKGIGLQIAKDLVAKGFTVLVGSRQLENGETAANSIGKDAHALQLDVTDANSVTAAAEHIQREYGRLDVLINNAGISHPGKADGAFPASVQSGLLTVAPIEDIRVVFETNVFGVIALTQAMLPLLHQAPAGRIVNIGSSGGSLTWNSNPDNPHRAMFGTYSASKSALHAITLAFAFALESTPIKVNIACPGFTSTALNNFAGTRSVEEGAREAVRLALIGADGPTGTFSDENGVVAW